MTNPILIWLVSRLEEPSTWAGLAALVGSLTFLPNASTVAQEVAAFGVAIPGLLAVVFPEKKP